MIPVPLYDFVRPRSKAGDNNNWTGPTMKSSYANKLISSQYVSKKLALPLQFFQESSLHGLKFIGQPKRHPIERIFWAVAFCISVILAAVSIHLVWKKYKDTPIITIFKPVETPVRLISFPAITICSANAVDKKKAEKLIERARKNDSDFAAFHKLYMIEQICQGSKSISEVYEYVGNQGKLPEDVREKVFSYKDKFGFGNQSQSISEFIMEVTDDCHTMILLCLWNGERQNCKRIIQSIVTDFGRCCSFNMLPASLLLSTQKSSGTGEALFESDNVAWEELNLDTDKLILPDEFASSGSQGTPKFPRRQNRPGKASGLSIVLNPNLNSYFCANLDSAGFMALAHSPLQFPRMSYDSIAIYPSFETFLQLKADITLAAKEISGFKPKARNCYFGNEYPLQFYKYYTMSNCEDECLANLTFNECGCIFHFMPRNSSMEVCGPEVIKCAEDTWRTIVQEGVRAACKMCLPSCTDIQYSNSASYLPLRSDVTLWRTPDGKVAPWAKDNVTILSFYFSGDSTYAKLRTQLYGPIELLSSTGGLLGLCLGFSALSLLEIFYFLTFRMYFDWKQVRLDAKAFVVKIGRKLKTKRLCFGSSQVQEWQQKDEFVISYLEPSF